MWRRKIKILQWGGKLKKYFSSVYFSQIHTMAMHIKFWQQHCNVQRPKHLTPWRDSNQVSSVLEADAMTTWGGKLKKVFYLCQTEVQICWRRQSCKSSSQWMDAHPWLSWSEQGDQTSLWKKNHPRYGPTHFLSIFIQNSYRRKNIT
jgi:hypothetical protein